MALNKFNAGFSGVIRLDRYTQADVIQTLWSAWTVQIRDILQNHCIGCTEKLDENFVVTIESDYYLDHTISIKLEDSAGESLIRSDCRHTTQSLLFAIISKGLLLDQNPIQMFDNVEAQRSFMNLYIRSRIPNLGLTQFIKHRKLVMCIQAHSDGEIRVNLIFELPDGSRLVPQSNEDLILLLNK